jgi:hypothetical protein
VLHFLSTTEKPAPAEEFAQSEECEWKFRESPERRERCWNIAMKIEMKMVNSD